MCSEEDEILCSDCAGTGEGRFSGNCLACRGHGVLYWKECSYCDKQMYGIRPRNKMEECSKECHKAS